MLDSLQTQPVTEDFHLAIPQGIFASLRIAVGGRAQKSSGVLRGVPIYPHVATGDLNTTHPGAVIHFTKNKLALSRFPPLAEIRGFQRKGDL
jgi:hypothetical protein